jgi:hypothetical protein
MCGCEPGYTCTRCADTPADPAYLDHDPRDDEQRERAARERDNEAGRAS